MAKNSAMIQEAQAALTSILEIDSGSLERSEQLGLETNFAEIANIAASIQIIFSSISQETLAFLPEQQIRLITSTATTFLETFQRVMDFSSRQNNSEAIRTQLISQAISQYNNAFTGLTPLMTFSTVTSNKVDNFIRDSQKTISDSIKEKTHEIDRMSSAAKSTEEELKKRLAEAEHLNETYRSGLTEQGVSKQSNYFAEEAQEHSGSANGWGTQTYWWAAGLGVFSFASFFIHKMPGITPTNLWEAAQLITSKILLVSVLTFMLIRSSRNYRAHKHNEVINRHKRNALLTYNALVEAGSSPEIRNTVLNHAAASIYATPDSGYVKSSTDSGNSINTIVEALPRMANQFSDGS